MHPVSISVKDLRKEFGDITALDTISFEVKKGELFGFIGPDGCYSFQKFYQTMTSNNDIEVEAWGLYQTDSNVCLTVMVYLNGHLNMTISAPGIYNLKIKQPDNNYLEKQLTVN